LLIIVDAHVHIYECFDLKSFFDSAFENFSFQAQALGVGTSYAPVLCLTEGKRDNWFGRLIKCAEGGAKDLRGMIGKWAVEKIDDSSSLMMNGDGGELLLVIAGRQIVTAERLGRPPFLPYPNHFLLGEQKGIRILPGSDPLPIASESWRPGSFGFSVSGQIDFTKPARDIKEIIMDPATCPVPYGKLEKFSRFIWNQCAMQLRKSKIV
jgi:hypothetical protein